MRCAVLLCPFLALVLTGSPGAAQVTHPDSPESGPVLQSDDAILFGAAVATTAALAPLDRAIARRMQDSTVIERHLFAPIASRIDFVVRPGSMIVGGGVLLLGHIVNSDRLADLGLHDVEAIAATEVVQRLLKGAVSRARPDTMPDQPFHFAPGRGFKDDEQGSFPSGHAATAFATAAVVSTEVAHWSRGARVPVAILMYGSASAAGLARVFENRHWASDVVMGAALGYLVGQNIVQANDQRSEERRESPSAVASRRGRHLPPVPLLSWSIRFR